VAVTLNWRRNWENNIERQHVEARLREMEKQNIKREEVEATLRDRIPALGEKSKERDLEMEEVKATVSGYTKGLEREGTDAKVSKQLVKKPQESDADREQVDFDLSGYLEKFKCIEYHVDFDRRGVFEELYNMYTEDEIFIDELEDDEYFDEPERREREMDSEFEMFRDENKELEKQVWEKTQLCGLH